MNFIVQKIFGRRKEVIWILIILTFLVCFGGLNNFLPVSISKYSYVFVSCLCGFYLKKIHKHENRALAFNKIVWLLVIVVIFFLLAFQDTLFSLVKLDNSIFVTRLYSLWNIIYAFVMVRGIDSIADSHNEENVIFTKISGLSFPIYLLHWPVICSVGSAIYLKSQFDSIILEIIVLFVSINIIVILLSILYQLLNKYLNDLKKIAKINKSI